MWLILVIGLITLMVGGYLAYLLDREKISRHKKLVEYATIVLATLIGVTTAFQLNRYQDVKVEKKRYKAIVQAVMFESAANHSALKVTKKNIKEGKIHPFRFHTTNASKALATPTFINQADIHLQLFLSMYKDQLEVFNRALDRYESEYASQGKVSATAKEVITNLIGFNRPLINRLQAMLDVQAGRLGIKAIIEDPKIGEIYSRPLKLGAE